MGMTHRSPAETAAIVYMLLMAVIPAYQYKPTVQLQYNHNGITKWKKEPCDGLLTFSDKDIVKIDPQTTASQCICEISIIGQVENPDDTFIFVWFGPGRGGTGYSNRAVTYSEPDLTKQGVYKKALKISIQPFENQQVTFFEERVDTKSLPFRIVIKGKLQMKCSANQSYESPFQTTTTSQGKGIPLTTTYSSISYTKANIFDNLYPGNKTIPKIAIQAFTTVQRPTHNNAMIIGVIFVLIFIIVFASSMILISLILHRKKLARQLALHIHTLEEARRPESLPLGQSSNGIAEKRVKLLSIRQLDSNDQENKRIIKNNCITTSQKDNIIVEEEPSSSMFEEDELSNLLQCNKDKLCNKTKKNDQVTVAKNYKPCVFNGDMPYIVYKKDQSSDYIKSTVNSNSNGVNYITTNQWNQIYSMNNSDNEINTSTKSKTCNTLCDDGNNIKTCHTSDYIAIPQTHVSFRCKENIHDELKT